MKKRTNKYLQDRLILAAYNPIVPYKRPYYIIHNGRKKIKNMWYEHFLAREYHCRRTGLFTFK